MGRIHTVRMAADERPSEFTPASKARRENKRPKRESNHAVNGSQRILNEQPVRSLS
jgi:hypothetical protein